MYSRNSPIHKLFHESTDSIKVSQDLVDNDEIYEKIFLIHDGDHCRRYGCRICSTKDEVEEHEKEWQARIGLLHKGKNERARQRRAVKIERLQQAEKTQQQPTQEPEHKDWNPLFMEELEE